MGYANGAVSQMYARRRRMEAEYGSLLPTFRDENRKAWPVHQNIEINHKNREYTILIGSDKHCKPGTRPQALRAFLHLAESIKPDYILINGDWFDFPSIGRFHRIGWESRPSVKEELEHGLEDLRAIKDASPKSKRLYILGNHDMRFNGILANKLPELDGVGFSLEEVINRQKLGYELCGLSVVFNDCLIVKHRWHRGLHSSFNDVVKAGTNIATGHDHKLNIRPWSDYNGTRYGIKTGTLSDLWDESFMYMENNPGDWQPGCVVVTVSGDTIIPEACYLIYDRHHKRRGQLRYCGQWYG